MREYNIKMVPKDTGSNFTDGIIWHKLDTVVCNKEKTNEKQPKLHTDGKSDSRLSGKWLPNFADRVSHVVSATDPHGRILGFLDRSGYCYFRLAPRLYSQGSLNPVPDPLLLIKSGSADNGPRDLWICSQELWPLDHRGDPEISMLLWNTGSHQSSLGYSQCGHSYFLLRNFKQCKRYIVQFQQGE
jgi:hypothetical protein